jgi:peptidoglycan/xylan/chitin deacetylase (PgdA/CDA1 family)
MHLRDFLGRAVAKYRRTAGERYCCRIIKMKTTIPIISFSFDDAPSTAFRAGGDILKAYGARATFYVSLGMLGCQSHSGPIASKEDLQRAVEHGHELGCHTFDHIDPWKTSTGAFVQSVLKNRRELSRILPTAAFTSFAYPYGIPRPTIKGQMGNLFACCRGGGQDYNKGSVDMNLVKGFFLDRRTGTGIERVKEVIDENVQCRGWLVFSTHDVKDDPSPYGCTREFLEEVVAYAAHSGASLLSVAKACEKAEKG